MTYNLDVETLRGTEYGHLNGKTYLDHGGTTLYAKSLVQEFAQDLLGNLYGNPHSASTPSAIAGHTVDAVRIKALRFFGADPEHYDLVFVSNATAAIKLVVECVRDYINYENKKGKKKFWYGYHKDAHNSVVGVREHATTSRCFINDDEVEDWIRLGITGHSHDKVGLFAYPGQSNMTGRRLPLSWSARIRDSSHGMMFTLLDAAALATTSPLDLSDPTASPDFVSVSFYKIFGFPDIGALIIRKAAGHLLQRRRYFGGGTIDMVIAVGGTSHVKRDSSLHDQLEDGTLPFHSIFALDIAIDVHARLFTSMARISSHTAFLASYLYDNLQHLCHANGSSPLRIYTDDASSYGNPILQGATIAFNVYTAEGKLIPCQVIEELADNEGIYVRSGSLCNPGGIATYLGYTPQDLKLAGVPLAKTVGQTVNNGAKAAPKAAEGNPAFRMMGLPNIKAKLPSRNWMIFLSITSSFAAAVYYDKRETARLQKQYCDLVAPLSEKILPTTTMPRKMTIYLQAPPADGLRSAREHFYEYVKPVLVAGAMDWDVVEGRREGDLRFGAAEKIRRYRRKAEGAAAQQEDIEPTKEEIVAEQRERVGCVDEAGVKGDLIIGRHAWKEYLRGVHEGWLGPLKEPVQVEEVTEVKQHIDGAPSLGDAAVKAAADLSTKDTPPTASTGSSSTTDSSSIVFDSNAADTSNTSPETLPEPPKEEEPPKPKLTKPDPYISTSAYASSTLPSSTPSQLGPAIAIPFPHLLGFWNFPIRIHRFLTRRYVAEEIFSRTAAAVLSSHRAYQTTDTQYLQHEEKEWHKSVRKPKVEEAEEGALSTEKQERLWLDDVVVDDRITSKLRIFELPGEGRVAEVGEHTQAQQPEWTYQGEKKE
ncbi:MAG: Uncharacterized protein AUREO_042220 [Aureobasidium pullulans]|nr:MAG: Uncharacterized protein AUREO_042220 [Aureobasidium pullulans]